VETAMPEGHRVADWDRDPYAWALGQATLIAKGSAGLKRLDLDGLKDFLEEAAEEMLSKATSQMVNLMAHAAKVARSQNPHVVGHWRTECAEFHDDIMGAYRASMRQKIDMETLWQRAMRKVPASFADHGEPAPSLPDACPFTVNDLVDPTLDFERLVSIVSEDKPGSRDKR
jgi:hypothetical protein